MGKKLFFLIIILSFFETAAECQPLLLNYQQLINLSAKNRTVYIKAMRDLAIELEKNYNRPTPNALIQFLDFEERAFADDVSNCVFAGWTSSFSNGGGHSYCTVPKAAHEGCKNGEIKCNPALFGADVCVSGSHDDVPKATLNCVTHGKSAADVARAYFTNGILLKNWLEFKASIENVCLHASDRQKGPCGIITAKLVALKKLLPSLPDSLSENNSKVVAGIKNSKSADAILPPCKNDRDQGYYGTCGAFCLLCTLDKLAASNKEPFRTSANWVTFLSIVDLMCEKNSHITGPTDLYSKTFDNDADQPEQILKLTMKYGYCAEDNFLGYSPREPRDYGAAEDIHFLKNWLPAQYDKTSHSKDDFYTQFGISYADAKGVYCPGGPGTLDREGPADSDYENRLSQLPTDTADRVKFMKCARESFRRAKHLESQSQGACKTKSIDLRAYTQENKIQQIKNLIDQKKPVSLHYFENKYSVQPNGFPPGHCVTVTDYDDKNQELDIISSHGDDKHANDPIKYVNDPEKRDPAVAVYLDCPVADQGLIQTHTSGKTVAP